MSETFWHVMHGFTALALAIVALWGYSKNELLKFYKSDAEWWRNHSEKVSQMYTDAKRGQYEAEQKIKKAQSALVEKSS